MRLKRKGCEFHSPLSQSCQGGQGGRRLRRQRGLCSLSPCCRQGGLGQRCGHFWLTLCLVLALCSVGFVRRETVRGVSSDIWKRHGEGVGTKKLFRSRAGEIMLVGKKRARCQGIMVKEPGNHCLRSQPSIPTLRWESHWRKTAVRGWG